MMITLAGPLDRPLGWPIYRPALASLSPVNKRIRVRLLSL
jgi:hypothetical protein